MNLEEVYEGVLPYLSNPNEVKEFLDGLKERSLEEVIMAIDQRMGETGGGLKTDMRILLNELEKLQQ